MIGRIQNSRGFTLIELLVVISIIALLSSVVVASLNQARDKARYAAVASELRQTQIAFTALFNELGCWPRSAGSGCGTAVGQTAVRTLITNGSFGINKYLPVAPSWPFSASEWTWDNDGDQYPTNCSSGYSTNGVKVFIANAEAAHYRAFNTLFDGDANPDTSAARGCGKILFSGTTGVGTLGFLIEPNP